MMCYNSFKADQYDTLISNAEIRASKIDAIVESLLDEAEKDYAAFIFENELEIGDVIMDENCNLMSFDRSDFYEEVSEQLEEMAALILDEEVYY